MIRGPSRGLGTFRCRCRWNLLLPLLLSSLLLFSQLHQTQASTVVSVERSTPSGTYISSSKTESAPGVLPSSFHQTQIPANMVKGAGGSGSIAGVTRHTRFQHTRHQQQQQEQQIQQQVVPAAVHSFGGYKPAAPTKDSNSGSIAEEGSLLRLLSKNNLYIESFPNGTVSATGLDTSFFSVLTQSAVDFGKIYIRGVASHLYLCINKCGRLYGSVDLEPDCILRDQMEGNWYNTYTSIEHSTTEKSLYMAFNSNTGSPCRLKMKSENTSDGRSIVALGSNEKYALFFPVRNISLPDGMNLTSLKQLNKWIPYVKNSVKSNGCAPRCPKLFDQSIKENSSNRASSKEKSNRKNKCSCLASETPAQGGGNVERCRRPRQCRPNAGQHAQKRHGESSNSNIATGPGWNQLQRSERLRNKDSRNPKPASTENRTSTVNLLSSESRLNPINRPAVDPSFLKLIVENSGSKSGAKTKTQRKSKKPTATHSERGSEHSRRKPRQRQRKDSNPGEKTQHSLSKASKNTTSVGSRVDDAMQPFAHRKSESRLIRHRYRKIRAHPELAKQLGGMY